jgi:predicted O-methyltransferase YrrM
MSEAIEEIVSRYIPPNIQGWMMEAEMQWLYEKACEMKNVLEVGSWMGRSTHALLSGCRGTVYAVDHFKGSASQINDVHAMAKTEDIHAFFLKNVGHFPNLAVLKMDSREAAKLFGPKWLDMIFIDGDHEYNQFRADMEAWLRKCRRLLCGHDFFENGVSAVLSDLNLHPQIIPGLSIWSIEL